MPTLGVIVGNRNFFPDHLCETGRQTVLGILREVSSETGATIVLADDDHEDISRAATHILDIDGGSYAGP